MGSALLPEYLSVSPEDLGKDTPVAVSVVGDVTDLAKHFAQTLFEELKANPKATLIVPVGPVDQYPILAQMINEHALDCTQAMLINMDEYLTDDDQWIEADHPLSFRGYMNRKFYDLVNPKLAPRPELRLIPDPHKLDEIPKAITQRGGVDTCYGGIGINGHMAFNEPPPPEVPPEAPQEGSEAVTCEAFAARPTRVLTLTPQTRTINSHTVGGEISIIPHRAVTVGMKEILGAKRLRFYCNRPWQRAVVRRVLHGELTAACPASLMRTHRDATLTITQEVAQVPDIRLR